MTYFENEILKEHPNAIICGIDEVGRGPLARTSRCMRNNFKFKSQLFGP